MNVDDVIGKRGLKRKAENESEEEAKGNIAHCSE